MHFSVPFNLSCINEANDRKGYSNREMDGELFGKNVFLIHFGSSSILLHLSVFSDVRHGPKQFPTIA